MGHPVVRLLMAVVGIVVFVFYAAVAYLVVQFVGLLFSLGSDPVVLLTSVAVATLAFGYLSYRYGTRRLLATIGAARLPRERVPGAYARLDRLCSAMEIDPPTLYVAGFDRPNALALGGARRGAVVVDRTLFRVLSGDEFEALVAHELAHLESHDGLVQTMAYSALRTVSGLLFVVILPVVLLLRGFSRALAWLSGRPARRGDSVFDLAHYLVERGVTVVLVLLTLPLLALSRRREFAADERAAEVTDPLALARALRKIERASMPDWGLLSLLYTRGDEEGDGWVSDLFSTHPDTDERVDRLVELASDRDVPRGRRIPIR
jgi:heat shock protein HtpX